MDATLPGRRAASRLALLAALSLSFGCATITRDTVRTDRTVLSSVESVERQSGDLRVREASWQGDRLVATIERELLCQKLRLSRVSYQKVREREARNVPPALLSGTLLAGAGSAAAWALDSRDLQYTPDGGQQTSAAVYPALAAVGGIGWFVDGALTGLKGIDQPEGPPIVEDEREELSAFEPCGPDDPPSGTLRVSSGDRVLLERPFADRKL